MTLELLVFPPVSGCIVIFWAAYNAESGKPIEPPKYMELTTGVPYIVPPSYVLYFDTAVE